MRGLIYDVHGNVKALEAVLADAGEAGVGRFLLGGDYALFGPHPNETLGRLRAPYDHEAVAAELRAIGAPWADRSARRVEHAAFVE